MNNVQRLFVSTYAKIKYRKTCIVESNAVVYGGCHFEGKNKISPGAHVTHSSLGYASYIGKNSVFSHALIGRFCSIGDDVKLMRAKHPVDGFASTHPAFYSIANVSSFVQTNKYSDIEEDEEGISLRVGNDVWIGSNVLIKAGVTIGDGAVIAMGAVVTKDIPAYAIVGGIPGQIIKYRFSESVREKLLQEKWWERDIDWIKDNAAAFESVDMLLDALSDNRKDNG